VELRINSTKTTVVIFTRRIRLEWRQKIKYLGIALDSKLIWYRHEEKIANKAKSSQMVCRNLSEKT